MAAPTSGLRPRHAVPMARREGADEMPWPDLSSSGPPAARAAASGGGSNATNSNRRSRNHSSHDRPLQPAAPAAPASTTTTTQTERRSDHRRRHHRCPQPARPQSARQVPEALVPLLSLEEQLGIQLTPRPSHRSFEEPPGLPPSSQRARTPPALSSRKTTGTETKVEAAAPQEPRGRVEAWARGKDFRAMVATLEEVSGLCGWGTLRNPPIFTLPLTFAIGGRTSAAAGFFLRAARRQADGTRKGLKKGTRASALRQIGRAASGAAARH